MSELSAKTGTEGFGERLRLWSESVSDWEPARECRERIERFNQRTASMQRRFGMPLIVALLGGTGTGKSTLINALLGANLVKEGKQRPTTTQPIMLCRPEVEPRLWGIDTSDIQVEKCDLFSLHRMVLIDCPDPDTTEDEDERLSNLARLRSVLPLCDILLVTGTQQKYRSRRVADELSEAAPGARLIFVQTNADRDEDIREDWARVLKDKYEPGRIYFVDSKLALSEQLSGRHCENTLSGDFGDLHRLLTREMNEEHALRVREANFFDLAEEVVQRCETEIEAAWPSVKKVRTKIEEEREKLGATLSEKMREELIQDRRLWENRLIDQITSRWGYSPFSIVLRTYQKLGSLAMGMALARARSIPQLAALGTVQGIRSFRKWTGSRKLKEEPNLQEYWDENTIRESNLVITGFAKEAKLAPESLETLYEESGNAGDSFARIIGTELHRIVDRLTSRNNTLLVRIIYETLISGMLAFVLYRPAYNFFIESFRTGEIWPLSSYLVSLIWFAVFAAIVLGIYLLTLSRGLHREIHETARNWSIAGSMRQLYLRLDTTIESISEYREQLRSFREKIARVKQESRSLDESLGRRK